MTGTPTATVACPACQGSTLRLLPCRCRDNRGPFPIAGGRVPAPRRDCQLCDGTGSEALACLTCCGYGRRRAQLVLTVANVDTGTVASREVVPGSVAPCRNPDGGWVLPLTDLLRDLAATVGVDSVDHGAAAGRRPVGQDLPLPSWWRPELPLARRRELEAAVLAGWPRIPWQVYLGGSSAAEPAAVPPLANLVRLGLGLGLTVSVTMLRRRPDAPTGSAPRPAEGWGVTFSAGTAPALLPIHPTVQVAVADCLAQLDLVLAETVPVDPDIPVVVPVTPVPYQVTDPVPVLARLAAQQAGHPILLRYAPTDRQPHLPERFDPDPTPLRPISTRSDVLSTRSGDG
ncbi:hypothetical protein [Plantactinospora sp. B24E8]|uniref:hypothetical protein n=1 Tax=Plantactinospora sp. B24E8 TaxID=3153567 RepID=UPI00325F16DF